MVPNEFANYGYMVYSKGVRSRDQRQINMYYVNVVCPICLGIGKWENSDKRQTSRLGGIYEGR